MPDVKFESGSFSTFGDMTSPKFRWKDCWAQIYDMLIDEDPLGQVKFVRLFKVTVLNLHVVMTKSNIKVIRFDPLAPAKTTALLLPVELKCPILSAIRNI